MREIARQIALQTDAAFGSVFGAATGGGEDNFDEVSLPPTSHLATIISALPTLARPTIVVLEGFDLFALHGRQALLYCLLDTAQSCHAGKGNKGIAVVGVTTRVDTINLLEKRVKSRFFGRILRTAGPQQFLEWTDIVRRTLRAPVNTPDDEWEFTWTGSVDRLLDDRAVKECLSDTLSLTNDVRVLLKLLVRRIVSHITIGTLTTLQDEQCLGLVVSEPLPYLLQFRFRDSITESSSSTSVSQL